MVPDVWAALRGLPVRTTSDGGLINKTYLAGDPPRWVVQWVNPLFKPSVHDDIEAVTAHVAARGMITPRLLRTDDGALCAVDDSGAWRVMSFVPGRTIHKVDSPKLAAAGGALVARFHAALDDLEWSYHHVRPGAHDTPAHMDALAAVATEGAAGALATRILEAWRTWPGRLDLPVRHAHGDLKISNLRFDDAGDGVCLLDLDTLALLSLDVELGDAWRSWCNPVGEDATETRFDLELFRAAANGYLQQRAVSADEADALVLGIERICLELAARFCRDVVEDRYFGWNADRFESRAAHNLFRAEGQLRLAASVRDQRGAAEQIVAARGRG
jgi:Ser/Thr protein kinase RdoA (MazF antagonist)